MATYLITGANRGIGLELARQLKAAGHAVIGTAREPGEARQLRDVADRVLRLDIADAPSVRAMAAELGETPIDVLVNNAAVGMDKSGFDELDMDRLERDISLNSVGTMRVTQALMRNLRAGGAKKIVGITSILGSIELTGGSMGGGSYAYRAGKAALNMLVRTLAADLAKEGFTCFVVHPGWVRTRMGGQEAPLSPQESVAGMVPVIERAGKEQNGAFLDYRGKAVAW